jgi:hypothetical protein
VKNSRDQCLNGASVPHSFHALCPARRFCIDHFARACKDGFALELTKMSVALEQTMETADPALAWIWEARQGQPA